ncbi:MAG: hypothetical protein ACK53Y_05885 [bacterium]
MQELLNAIESNYFCRRYFLLDRSPLAFRSGYPEAARSVDPKSSGRFQVEAIASSRVDEC